MSGDTSLMEQVRAFLGALREDAASLPAGDLGPRLTELSGSRPSSTR